MTSNLEGFVQVKPHARRMRAAPDMARIYHSSKQLIISTDSLASIGGPSAVSIFVRDADRAILIRAAHEGDKNAYLVTKIDPKKWSRWNAISVRSIYERLSPRQAVYPITQISDGLLIEIGKHDALLTPEVTIEYSSDVNGTGAVHEEA
jgi:hypothetical protein